MSRVAELTLRVLVVMYQEPFIVKQGATVVIYRQALRCAAADIQERFDAPS